MFGRSRSKGAENAGLAATTDEELGRRVLARDRAAFSALVERLHERMIRLALVYVGERGMAEEVAQDAWAAVLDNLASFEGRSSLTTWIFRIVVNRAKSRAEREARTEPFSAIEPASAEDDVPAERFDEAGMWRAPPAPWQADTPEGRLVGRQGLAALAAALDSLPPAQRAVVVLRDVEGHEAAEVCNILGISESNQRVLLHRGRTRLHQALERAEGAEPTP